MDKTELPTATYLQSLREQGIIPRSQALTRAVSSFAVVVSVLVIIQSKKFSELFQQAVTTTRLDQLVILNKQVLTLILAPILAVMIAALLIGFFQTRFRLQALFLRNNYKSDYYKGSALLRIWALFFKITASFIVGLFVIILAGRFWLLPLVGNQQQLAERLTTAALRTGFLALVALALCAGLAFVYSRVRFIYENRVSANLNEERDDPKVGKVF